MQSSQSTQLAIDRRCVRRNDQFSDRFVVSRHFLHVKYIINEHMLGFNFMFDVLWTGRCSLVCSVAFLGFRELKLIENRGPRVLHVSDNS